MRRIGAIARACCAALAACLIASCSGGGGGGGGGGSPPQFVVSPTTLSFSAANPSAAQPPSQVVTATVNGVSANTLFVRVVVSGPAVTAVDNLVITGPNSGQMMVHVANPATIGPGNHASVITVTACTTDVNCSGPQLTGSPATINVAYQVGAVPPPPDAVAPSVGTANAQGDVILRGQGFTPGTTVSFGGTPAVGSIFLSSTEIHATYPALAPGAYAVTLTGSGAPFSASLQLVAAGGFATATIAYPLPLPQNMRGFVFDARRQTLVVGAGFSLPASNQVLRYAFNGTSWQTTPDAVTLANLRGFALSTDGEKLLALTNTTLVELHPVTLATQATTPRTTNLSTDGGSFLKSLVATNDGQAFVMSGGPNFNQHWLYSVAGRTFSAPFAGQFSPAIGGPDNGSRVVLVEGGLSPAQPVQVYSASSGVVTSTSVALAHDNPVPGRVEDINPPVFDRAGTRMLVAAFSGGEFHAVFDANFSELGRVPSNALVGGTPVDTASYALSPSADRAYTLEIGTGICRVRAFDLSGSAPGAGVLFPEIVTGFPIDLSSACPGSSISTPIRMLLNPAGDTLFIAGNLSIRVVAPLP